MRSCMAYQRCFSHIISRQILQVSSDSESYDSEFHHYGNSPCTLCHLWQTAVPHTCGILLVLRCLASVLWMFSIIIKIHNIQPIHNGSMAFILFINLNNFLATNMIQNDVFATRLKYSNNLLNYKMNYEDNHRVNTQSSKPFTVCSCASKPHH